MIKEKSVRNRKNKNRIKLLILQATFMGMLLIASTYAWFTAQKDVSISNLKGTVEVAESMEISLDAKNWAQEIDLSTVNLLQATSGSNLGAYRAGVNVAPKELLPVSSVGDSIGQAKLNMYSGTANGTKLSDIVACDESETDVAQTDYAGYYAFDVFIRNTSKDNTADTLQLNTNSIVQVLQNTSLNPYINPYGDENKTYVGNAESGLQNTVRIGFALYNNTADATASSETIITDTVDTSNTIKDIAIWEPNSEAHVDYIKANNNNIKLNGTAFDFTQTANAKHTTYGVNKDAVSNDIENVYLWGTGNNYVSAQNTVQTTSGLVSNVVNLTNVNNGNFQIEANKVSRLRIYVWLEGQDVDCINWASYGGGIQATIGLIKDEEVDASGAGAEIALPANALSQNITAANYGEYVNYDVDIDTNEASEDNDWRIFYNDGNNVYIIADDYLLAQQASGTVGCGFNDHSGDMTIYEMNTIQSANSISKFMIQNISDFTNVADNYKSVAYLLTERNWSTLKDTNGYAESVIGSPTIEMWTASWNEKGYTKLYNTVPANDGYCIGTTASEQADSVQLSTDMGYEDLLYFPRESEMENCNGYWLASPAAAGSSNYLFYIDTNSGEISAKHNDTNNSETFSVRPIICLNSNVLGEKDENGVWRLSKD